MSQLYCLQLGSCNWKTKEGVHVFVAPVIHHKIKNEDWYFDIISRIMTRVLSNKIKNISGKSSSTTDILIHLERVTLCCH